MPDDPEAGYARGLSLLEEGKRVEACRALEAALAVARSDPGRTPLPELIKSALASVYDWDACLVALQRQPDDPEARSRLAMYLRSYQKDAAGAIGQLEEAIARSPDHPEIAAVHLQLGKYLGAERRDEEAVRHYHASLARGWGGFTGRLELAGLLERLGRPAEAREELERARDLIDGEVARFEMPELREQLTRELDERLARITSD